MLLLVLADTYIVGAKSSIYNPFLLSSGSHLLEACHSCLKGWDNNTSVSQSQHIFKWLLKWFDSQCSCVLIFFVRALVCQGVFATAIQGGSQGV